jgi:glucose-6-phosphate 1-epimerase
MSAQPLDVLARDFSADGVVWTDGPGGLPFLVVETDRCRARLTPYGGQLCEWTPAGQPVPALFLSPRSVFAAGTAIRGGVPICFPWFANHPGDPTKPAHGFARTRTWQVAAVTRDHAGDARVALRLTSDAGTRGHWDAEFAATLTLSLGTSLAMTVEVVNTGVADLTYEIALHTYLTVGDVEKVRLHGLEGARFIDKVDGAKEKIARAGPLALAGDTDRVFLDTTAACTVDDPVLRRRVRIEKSGSRATVVWNPGREKARAVPDIGGEAWRTFVCVETANCGPHAVRLAPRARHAMAARIEVTPRG